MRRIAIRYLILASLCLVTMGTSGANDLGFYAKYHVSYFNFLIKASSDWTDGDNGRAIDTPMDLGLAPQPCAVAATYKTFGEDGWNGTSGYYLTDVRGPVSPGTTKVFDSIYLWAMPGTPNDSIRLSIDGYAMFDPGLTYKLSLVSTPAGVAYTGPTEWTMTHDNPTHPDVILPYYATSDPSTGYQFRAEVTAVPEPCSLLALVSGLAGVGAWLRRRRV